MKHFVKPFLLFCFLANFASFIHSFIHSDGHEPNPEESASYGDGDYYDYDDESIDPETVTFPEGMASSPPPQPEKTLKVGTILVAPYMVQESDGEYSGFVKDLLERVMTQLGWKFTIEAVNGTEGPWNEIIQKLANKEIDIAAAPIAITEDRKQSVQFTKPFMHTYMTAIFQCHRTINNNLEDLVNDGSMRFSIEENNPILVQMKASSNPLMNHIATNISLLTQSNSDGVRGVSQDPNLAFILDSATALWVMANRTDCWMQRAYGADVVRDYAFAVHKNFTNFAQLDNATSNTFQEHELSVLSQKWWGNDLCYEEHGDKRCVPHRQANTEAPREIVPSLSSSSKMITVSWMLVTMAMISGL